MYRVRSSDFTSVGNGDCDLELPVIWLGVVGWFGGDLEIRVLEGSVGETVTEWEERSDLSGIVVLVSDPDTFFVVNLGMGGFVVQAGRDVFFSYRKRDGQSTRWVDFTVNNIGDRVSGLVTSVPCEHDTGNLFDPRHGYRRTGLNDDNSIGVGLGDSGDELVLTEGQKEVGPVVSFRLPVRIETTNNDCFIGLLGECDGILDSLIGREDGESTDPDTLDGEGSDWTTIGCTWLSGIVESSKDVFLIVS
jgi:hypothetical protein